MATAAEQVQAAAGDAEPVGVRSGASLARRLLVVALFLLLFAGFSLVPALQGLSLSAGQDGAPREPAERAADSLAAEQAEALASRP